MSRQVNKQQTPYGLRSLRSTSSRVSTPQPESMHVDPFDQQGLMNPIQNHNMVVLQYCTVVHY